MVFESVITEVLNRFLGDYVENLDSKQLKIGIWGGDVVLNDLILKPAALDELDLPIQCVYGRLGTLILKIPWKNLYGAAVEATIDGLYLLIVPNQQVTYDAEKEASNEFKSKQNELERIEDAKKREAEKGKPKPDDTFAEKLVTQIIKNVQLKISNIHIRYEDEVTHTGHPFAMGITLGNLSLQTTDESWKPTIVQEMVTKIYKVVSLEGLAAYWNCKSDLYVKLPTVDLLYRFNKEIADKIAQPDNYDYVLGPINSSARLILNPKPDCDETPFSIPKVHLNLELEKLSVGISKAQYRDIIALAESMERMLNGEPYRKFRPKVPGYKGHYKEWWKFAYVCVLEGEVRRKRRNWDWENIIGHRTRCKEYAKHYQTKLQNKKIPEDVQKNLNECEKKLDLINIVIIRKKIELEVARLGKAQEVIKKKSWFGGWWGGATDKDKDLAESTDIVRQFEAAMTPEEKSRLYKAIDYQENSAPLEYPAAYVDKTCTFVLKLLEVNLFDETIAISKVLCTELIGVKCRVDTRAGASALKVNVNIDEFTVFGIERDELLPELVTSKTQIGDDVLLDVLFEINPLDSACAQRLHVNSKPLKVIYDAETIIKVFDIFNVPQSSALEQISLAAESKFSDIKEMSATGLQYAIEKHTSLELRVDLHAPYFIIPYEGRYTGAENVLVIDLGRVQVSSIARTPSDINIRAKYATGVSEDVILKEMIDQSYDQFLVKFTDLQIVLAQGGEDWLECISNSQNTSLHILNPMSLHVKLFKCLISDDPRLPLNKISLELPLIYINMTDARLLLLLALATSIPLPTEDLPENKPLIKAIRSHGSSTSMLKYLEVVEKIKPVKADSPERTSNDFVQFTTLEVNFVLQELIVVISHQELASSPSEKMIDFQVATLQCDLVQQTHNLKVVARLGSISCNHFRPQSVVNIISTPLVREKGEYLFIVEFLQVKKISPEFHSKYQSCESKLSLEFASLNVILHQQALQDLMKFGTELQLQIEEIMQNSLPTGKTSSTGRFTTQLSSITDSLLDTRVGKAGGSILTVPKRVGTGTKMLVETIQFKLLACLQELRVQFTNETRDLASCTIKGIKSDVIVKSSYTQVTAILQDVTVMDLDSKGIHAKILSVVNDKALIAEVVMYNLDQISDPHSVDVSVKTKMGCLRFVFLNRFVSNMLDFLNQFQAARDTIIEASQAAAQSAKQNMQVAYVKATRISLDVALKAPDIIIPVNATSFEALLLDMGHITLVNKFLNLEIKNEQGNEAVVDKLKLELTEFKLVRIKLGEDYSVVNQCVLLEPVTFTVEVKRNLSSSWYNAIPDLDLSGKINTIKLQLSRADFKMIMSVVNENLAEGNIDSSEAQSRPEIAGNKIDAMRAVESKRVMHETTSSKSQGIPPEKHKVHVMLKFSVSMDSLIINLFTGGSKTLSGKTPTHDPKNALARFSLETLSIKGRILTDNLIVTSVLLVNCLLDDMRCGRENKLNRLLERKTDNAEDEFAHGSTSSKSFVPLRSMLDVTFQQKDNDTFADVRVYSIMMILSVDYLVQIVNFFTSEVENEAAKSDRSNKLAKSKSSRSTAVSSRSNASVAPKNAMMTFSLRVEKPDIILVEHMDNIDANALIFNTEMIFKLRMTGSHQVVSGTVKDLQLYTCCYDPAKRLETQSSVLHPVNISIAGSTPEDKGLHLEVFITDMRISVSPTTIELLNRVHATMYSADVKKFESDSAVEDHSRIWEYTPFKEQELWFLKSEYGEDATAMVYDEESQYLPVKLQELCIVSLSSLIVTIEAGVGNKTLPMLLLESGFQGNVKNWSTQMFIEASLTLQMGYYNSQLALWEPLIEPVEIKEDNRSYYAPWELKLEMSINEQDDQVTSPTLEAEQIEEVAIPQAAMSIDISSRSNLEICVTKTCLDVLYNLGNAFTTAIEMGEVKKTGISASHTLKNESGLKITLSLDKGAFKVDGNNDPLEVVMESGAEVPLQLKATEEVETHVNLKKGMAFQSPAVADKYLYVTVNDPKCDLELPVVRADKRFFSLKHRGDNHDNWGIISAVSVENGVHVVTLRSILQVHNHFSCAVDVYYMTARGNELLCIGSVEPGATMNIPVKSVYTPTCELFFSVNGYSVTASPFVWKDLQVNLSATKLLQCTPKNADDNNEPFIMKAIGHTHQVYYENTCRCTMASTTYSVSLHPAVTLKNCLPINIICSVQNIAEEKTVKPGEVLQMPNVDPGQSKIVIRLPEYLEKEWSCKHEVGLNPQPFSVWQFDSYDSASKMSLDLGMHAVNKGGSMMMTLYCPFWMLNKTGLLISYRKSKKTEKNEASGSPAKNADENLNILHHPATFKGPILFSFNAKNFFGKKKACIRVEQGEWSDKFSLDVAGSSGVIACKANNMVYEIGVSNQLTYNGLTKQVTFTPYYVIINTASFAIECQELDRPADSWTRVEPNSCCALWPRSEKDNKLLKLRVVGTTDITAPFLYTETHTSLLKIPNKFGGINVDIQMTEGAVYINLTFYGIGMAPALIINHTKDTMCLWEKETVQVRHLKPMHKVLYTWENPSGPRVLVWDIGNKKEFEDDLRKDGVGEFTPENYYRVYWVSFLDGMQRVLLFTTDADVAESVQSAKQFEAITQEITVSIHGLGLSFVNNPIRQEIMYVGIASSGIIWESCKLNSRRFKQLSTKESIHLESAHQQYLLREALSASELDVVVVDNKMEVDFSAGLMLKPHKRKIRRTFQTGLWFQMKSSPNQLQLHAKVNRLQIDNQMYDSIFPVVLAPVPPPKSVAGLTAHKPFAELSIVQRLMKHSQIKQFKYFKVLVQEFHIKVDLGFVNAIVDLLQGSESTDREEQELFVKDLQLVDEQLYSHVSTQSLQEQKHFYDLLHFSPFKIHISFSMTAGSSLQGAATPNFLNVLLQGLGVTLTDMQDVIFRLAYFEREYSFLTQRQLIREATTHYVGQSVKQLYVLVLGLDVLGNPYGLVLGITKGVEDLFYEPFQGAIQGPGEFAEGLVLGVRSLFGHTVGGAAGAVSRITGAMGKGIAALTFDKDYQRKRRDQINKKPATVQEGIARGGKGLVMGVFDGVTGVFTKPISGAKEQGVEGFFKGLGKGAMGLVTRPTAGVIDFASGSLDAVKRATELSEDTNRLRPPRFLHADGLVKPYNQKESEGHKFLVELEKGKYSNTDVYMFHFIVIDKKEILMLTDKRIAYMTHNDIFGGWQIDWSHTWQDLQLPAKIVPKGVAIATSEVKRKKLGLFGSSDSGKIILIGDVASREIICNKIEELRKKA